MKRILFLFTALMICEISFCQDKPKDFYTSEMKALTFRGWKIEKGDKIGLDDNDTLIVSSIQKYTPNGKPEYVIVGINLSGKKQYYEIEKSLRERKIKTPPGITLTPVDDSEIPNKGEAIEYESTVDVMNTPKDVLYDRTKVAFARIFKDANSVIQVDDKEAGHIVGKGYFAIPYAGYWDIQGLQEMRVYFICDIKMKDSKYRVKLYDFSVKRCNAQKIWDCKDDSIYRITSSDAKRDKNATVLFQEQNKNTISLFELMIKQSQSEKNDNW